MLWNSSNILLVIDLPLLFVFRDIVNHFGLEITVDLVRAVDLKVVVIPGRIKTVQFICWMFRMK